LLFQAIFAWITYDWYGKYVVSGRLAAGSELPWTVYLAVLAYVAVPLAAGTLVGAGIRRATAFGGDPITTMPTQGTNGSSPADTDESSHAATGGSSHSAHSTVMLYASPFVLALLWQAATNR
jgi:hypothetical protein